MATRFFLADKHFMDQAEIAEAERFDETALVCHKSYEPAEAGKPRTAVFRLELPNITFYNLPREAQLINDNNNLEINTVGDLIDATRQATSKVITRYQVEEDAKVQLARLIEERKGQKEWAGLLPERLPPSCSRVAEYARRVTLS